MRILLSFAIFILFLSACKAPNVSELSSRAFSFVKNDSSKKLVDVQKQNGNINEEKTIDEILSESDVEINLQGGFKLSMQQAINLDPTIRAERLNLEADLSAVQVAISQKDFQVFGSVYGGVEDLTDEIAGVALVLDANRLVYDGGLTDSGIAAKKLYAMARAYTVDASVEDRGASLAASWVNLERYRKLKNLIDQRLEVLNPLIKQLETVAKAGIGDFSAVAAAQQTVSQISVTQTDVYEKLAQAELEFFNMFGGLPQQSDYDDKFISEIVPSEITEPMIKNAPNLKSYYASYQAALSEIKAIEAKEGFSVGFEARATRPFGGSDRDSEERFGLVAKKTLYNGKMIASELARSKANVASSLAQMQAAYREGARIVKTAEQTKASMKKAINLARDNADATSKEVSYLRRQLVIGGSTLGSILKAEARLYEAESKEINFRADLRLAELQIITALGLLGPAVEVVSAVTN